MLRRDPADGNVLGSPNAPVTMVEYIDLQCPDCRQFETGVMPTIISSYVRNGKVQGGGPADRVHRRGVGASGGARCSRPGSRTSSAQFKQLIYFNQGPRTAAGLTDQLVAAAAASIPGLNVQQALSNRTSPRVLAQTHTFDQQANADRVLGTPTVLIGKTGGKLTNIAPGGAPDVPTVEAAIKKARVSSGRARAGARR